MELQPPAAPDGKMNVAAPKKYPKQNSPKLQEIFDEIIGFTPKQKDIIRDAYYFTERAHEGQLRKSGEPYLYHLVETAKNLAKLGMGPRVIAAGLLHDSIEDGVATEEEILYEFGEEVLFLIDGVTKLGRIRYHGMRRHNESLRKLFVATSRDVRVLIIKFCDRLHNMETLEHVREDKRLRIATETLEIYAPLAYRLGITTLSKQLEDLSFPYVFPEDYKKVRDILRERSKQTLGKLEHVERSISKKMAIAGMRNFRTSNRIKGLYSLYKKLQRKNWDVDNIYDVAALRIIVPTIGECYQCLGIVHEHYRPMLGRIKDYIAVPKPNGYRSLHTTIFTGDGGLLEIQIRTEEMHRDAELGAASHLGYKSQLAGEKEDVSWMAKLFGKQPQGPSNEAKVLEQMTPTWIAALAEHSDNPESEKFETELKEDFFKHQIFVFTPKGEAIALPEDSTPIDFAFQVHSEIGLTMTGTKIHGKMASLDTKLKNGDIVEVITGKKGKPTAKWLDIAITNEARRKIKGYLEKVEEEKREREER